MKIRLSESRLNEIISESVKKVLKELTCSNDNIDYSILNGYYEIPSPENPEETIEVNIDTEDGIFSIGGYDAEPEELYWAIRYIQEGIPKQQALEMVMCDMMR